MHVFLTYLAYARQDRPVKDYKGFLGADVIQMIEGRGAKSLTVVDIHCEQLLNSASQKMRVRNVWAGWMVHRVIDRLGVSEVVLVCPDIGAVKRGKETVKWLQHHYINEKA